METNALNNQSREELFETIKGKCKSRAKRNIYGLLVTMIIVMVILIIMGQRLDDTRDIIGFIIWMVIGLIVGGVLVHNYRLKEKIDKLDAPEQLLSLNKKTTRVNTITGYAAWVLVIAERLVQYDFLVALEMLVAFIVIIALTANRWGYWFRQEDEITDQLQELIQMK